MSSIDKESEIELECSLCKDIYREPKTLGCLHSFCLECLEIYVERNHSNIELKCPICRTPFQFESQEHLAGLLTDSYLLNALNFHNPLKNSISEDDNQKLICLDQENEATSYCLNCQEYYCEKCVRDHQHPLHKILTILDVIGNQKHSLIDSINKVKPKEKELKEGINKCEEVIKQLEINSTTTQIQIIQLFQKIRIKIDEKEQELLNKLDVVEKYQKKELELQKGELKFGIESIIGSCQMIQNSISLSNNNKNDNLRLLSMKKLYESRLDYLSNNIWKIEPCHNPFIEFLNSEELIFSSISNFGTIDANEVLAQKCLISRDQKQKIFKDEFKFEIISYSKEGNEMRNGGNGKRFTIQIEGESESEDENQENNEWEIKDLNNGRYEPKIKFKDGGKYLIFVQYDGVDINSSPFQIQVFSKPKPRNYNEINQPKLTFGSFGNGNGQFSYPREMIINSKRNILICDSYNHRIQIFDSEGKFISTFGLEGMRNGQFNCTYGITINSKGNIIVCDNNNHRIQIFDSEGKFVSVFGSYGNGNGQFNNPRGICVDLNDNIYVCDFDNHRIQIFNSEGKFISTFGSEGKGNRQFHNPTGITINAKGNIIVSEYYNHRIQIFDSERKFVSKFGLEGKGNDQLKNPWGICVDLNDNIFVCDFGNNRIQIFNSNGEYITQFKVNQPTSIIIDPKTQNLIICRNDHKVSIF